MEAFQNGSTEAFDEIFHRYSPRLYGFLRKKNSDASLAEDVFQATFQKLHQNRSRYDPALPFSGWIFTICRNALYDHLRRQQRRREAPSEHYEVLLEGASTQTLEETDSLEILERLPSTQKQAVELRYYENLPFEEIALRLNTSSANARQLVSRAIRKLRSILKN